MRFIIDCYFTVQIYQILPGDLYMFALFLKGLIIGFAIAAPVGPIGVLCIQRSLHNGFKIGLMTGIGAALADGTYGLIAGFGLTALSSFLVAQQFWIRLIGGLFLLYLGIKLFLTPPQERSAGSDDRSLWHAFGTTYLLTITNPATILSFIAIFASLGLKTTTTDYLHAIILVIGITLGSAIWWLLLSGGVAFILHHRLNPAIMRGINRFSGIIILAFGLFALSMR
jgi:threonine/homoserine/homoserine lactone efflux protein